MFYLVTQSGYRNARLEVDEFSTEQELVQATVNIAKSRIVAIFKGERLEPVIGERKITKKTITGFKKREGEL